MSGPLFVKVDWAKNGTFTDAGDDVTSRVRGSVTATYGRDQVTALSPIIAGRGGFDLDNHSKDYSPRNAASPLFGKIKPSRPVLITRVVGATTYTIFRGHTDDSPINPDVDAKTVSLSLVDGLADFRGINLTTQLYQGIPTGTAIGLVLDGIGWTGGRDIDTGATTIPWWWEEGTDAFEALQKILASEGQPSFMSIDVNGGFVFRDRHHRLRLTASKVSQATYRGTDRAAEPVMSKGFTYSDNWQNIVNSVSFSVNERALSRDPTQLWSTSDTITLGVSEVRTYVIQTSDPFMGLITPVAGTDYNLTSGGLTSITLGRTSGAATAVTLTAGGSGAVLAEGLSLRGYAVPIVRTYQVQATDSGSITDYGQRALPSGQEPVWASLYDVQAIANLLVLQRAQPLPLLNVRFSCQHTQTARLNAVLTGDLSDRVTVIETETGVNSDFFIESISHEIASLADHSVTFGLEGVPASPSSAFILDTSTLNGASPLGY